MWLSRIARAAASGGLPAPLSRCIPVSEFYIGGALDKYISIPNLTRQPLLKRWWQHFFIVETDKTIWTNAVTIGLILFFSGWLSTPPMEKLDMVYLNGEKSRILNAWHNEGKRPALAMALQGGWIRYFLRGLDHPFSLNEKKDALFKMRENYLIAKHPGVQYPFVFRHFNKVQTPDVLEVHVYPTPQAHTDWKNAPHH
uniref:Uncharacterized protein n=1 Tax=Chromera velia CCMP2878 TaxID=1169474 RepID=A0A0G4FMB5_9ALVE|mmetsp:Transcript_34835/g.68778  ORF Transcript_34835/g.68778 Transcript_34835/m.68778 type:complete len:198 (+) Transcript_34835:214-807(+)|eukprot:Cvel_17739.t1-p1 / transcript=Cvel_17739.t1 / gene=Cvel_17739 / organism=Chromera_velia_CCMP2878 / gene_product=hypothetical protein / transcript_product=hypothetical protein / location=Cvel_scaffold1433:24837-25427(+) / protein_length=197 / sequence_SO=supercontig / SO=protein_coding / is_pseudo=false